MNETRTTQPITIETRPSSAATVRSTFYEDGSVGHVLFIEGVRRTGASISTAALLRSLKRHAVTGWVCPDPEGTFYTFYRKTMGFQTYVFGLTKYDVLYADRALAEAGAARNNTDEESVSPAYRMAFDVIEVRL